MANEVKRQHYVPRAYLKNFAEQRKGEHYIHMQPIEKENVDVKETNIINACLSKHLYTLPGETPEERMALETFYGENLESHYTNVYQLLTDQEKKGISEEERRLIISTVVTMLYRTTKWITDHNELMKRDFARLYELCKQTGKDYFLFEGVKVSIRDRTLEQFQKQFLLEQRPSQVLMQLEVALKLIDLRIASDDIFVVQITDDENEFITSDNPVSFHHPEHQNAMPFDPENILAINLNTKFRLYLMPFRNDDTTTLITRNRRGGKMAQMEVLTANGDLFGNAERFILGPRAAIEKFIALKDQVNNSQTNIDQAEAEKKLDEIIKKMHDLGMLGPKH